MRNSRFRCFLTVISGLVLISFIYARKDLFLNNTQFSIVQKLGLNGEFSGKIDGFFRVFDLVNGTVSNHTDTNALISIQNTTGTAQNSVHNTYGTVHNHTITNALVSVLNRNTTLVKPRVCPGLYDQKGNRCRCDYLIARPECRSKGVFNYTAFFYCDFDKSKIIGYMVLGSWLAILFYLLGNTAADYFCCSLEKLSYLLKMSPSVAGVTLLPLGNGAPDVFASIVAFSGSGSGDVGLNSVLGGAVFVTCIVVGVVSFCVSDKRVQIDRKCFLRDLGFFLLTVTFLLVILIIGKVSVAGAVAFLGIYVAYGFVVAADEVLLRRGKSLELDALTPLLPVVGDSFSRTEDDESMFASLVSSGLNNSLSDVPPKLPHLKWTSNITMYSDYAKDSIENSSGGRALWCWTNEHPGTDRSSFWCSKICSLVEMPFTIPRRLTIPIIEEERWSKGYAVASVSLAPVLLAFLWNTKHNAGSLGGEISYIVGVIGGISLGILAFIFTKRDHPPRKFLFPWVLGGFFMSIVWFYIIASELVELLVSLGVIIGINPSLLALTILAWGNSMGDLLSNIALAMNERSSVQIAMSGCYAVPMFNLLIGLGTSMLLATLSRGSQPYTVPRDTDLFFTSGFLMLGLIWALIVLPQSDMRPNKILGIGLITIYLMFLCFQVGIATGVVSSNSHD